MILLLLLFSTVTSQPVMDCTFSDVVTPTCQTMELCTVSPQPGEGMTSINMLFDELELDPGNCVNITLREGRYVLTREFTIEGGSVSIRGEGRVRLSLRRGTAETGGLSPLLVRDAVYVEVVGITMNGSFGFIEFNNVQTVIIQQSRFRGFQAGTLDFTDCGNILIEDCLFANNGQSTITRSRTLQGGAGGLSIQYSRNATFTRRPEFHIRNVIFRENTAGLDQNLINSGFTEVTDGNFYTGRGGAIFLLMGNRAPVLGRIEMCRFGGNNASLYGGAVYVAFNSLSNHNISITDSQFRNNEAILAGGAVMISYQEGGDDDFLNSVELNRCSLERNSAEYGGAVYFFVSITSGREDGELGTFAAFISCNFSSNVALSYGAALGATALNLFESKDETRPAEITDCIFESNLSMDGATVAITNFPFILQGSNVIQRNTGPSLLIVGAIVKLSGQIDIINNDVREESTGVLLFLSNGQADLMRRTRISIINNTGGWGAGLVPTIAFSPSAFDKLIGNPLCSLLYEDRLSPPDDWEVTVRINGNNAIVGSAVYANNLNLCSWTNGVNFDLNRAYRWSFMNIGRDNNNKARPGNRDRVSNDVQTQAVRTTTVPMIEGFPGEDIRLSISSFSETGNITYAVWSFQVRGDDVIVFDPSAVSANNDLWRRIRVTFYQRDGIEAGPSNPIEATVQAITLLNEEETRVSFKVRVRDCPAGTILKNVTSNSYYGCLCNLERTEIAECEGGTIYLTDYRWATESRREADNLFLILCPPGHCQCTIRERGFSSYFCDYEYNRDEPDMLCTHGRSGVLCGECINNTGVTVLTNKCTSCHDGYSVLIAILIIADVIAFVGILIAQYPLDDWFHISLYYLQLLPILTLLFPETFEYLHPYLYYIASFLSFYFPYDFCLYSNMSTLVSYTLKFIPFIIAIITFLTVTFIRDFLLKSKLKRVPHHGAVDIMRSLYTPTLYAAVSVLNCPSVPIAINNQASLEYRWFYDGTVKCFEGGHLALSLFALIVIVGLLVSIFFVFMMSFDKIEKIRHFHFSSLSMTYPYKKRYAFWESVEFVKRTVMVVMVAAFPAAITFHMVTVFFFTGLQGMLAPYKSKLSNITDFVLGCLVSLLLLVSRINYFWEIFHYEVFEVSNTTDANGSSVLELDLTPFAAILGFLYYLPFAVMVVIGSGATSVSIYKYIKEKQAKKQKMREMKETIQLERVFSTRGDVNEQRERAGTTYIVRSASDTPISPTKLEASVEVEWTPRSYREERTKKRSLLKKKYSLTKNSDESIV